LLDVVFFEDRWRRELEDWLDAPPRIGARHDAAGEIIELVWADAPIVLTTSLTATVIPSRSPKSPRQGPAEDSDSGKTSGAKSCREMTEDRKTETSELEEIERTAVELATLAGAEIRPRSEHNDRPL
jgi:hypothetical protein